MKVFIAIASVRMAYGGPAVSVAALAGSLARAGIETGLWCPDGSAPTVLSAPEAPLRLLAGSLDQAMAEFGMPDVIHDNGLWWAHNHRITRFAARCGIPRVVSPRGMLEPWARRHKRVRKTVAWHLYQARDLRAAQALHVTSAPEGANLAAVLPDVPVCEIGNGLAMPDEASLAYSDGRALAGPRRALFLGRLHPVKGLPTLLEAWHRAALRDWKLVIAGPDEAGHRQHLEAEVDRLGLAGSVTFPGPFSGAAKTRLLKASHLFVLPSHSESFGMAVGEALAHGLPVVTTRNVPWPQLEALKCGWRTDLTAKALAGALAEAAACSDQVLAAMGRRGRQLVADEFSWEPLTQRYIALYASLLTQDNTRSASC